ncbi:MAG: hypothetical protein K2M78_13095 [Lachnospiraceae bacterium]|nr:hypothetical protein [Lachnospiraceae bacterium]
MYKKLKLVGMLSLIIVLLFTNEKGVYAEIGSEEEVSDESQSGLQKLNEYALSFGKFIANDESIYVADILKIYDENGICEYCFDYESGGVPYGYAIYNIENSDITVFSIEKGQAGLYEKIISSLSNNIFEKTNILLKNVDLDYFAVLIQDEEEIAVNRRGETVKGEALYKMGYNPISTLSYDDIFDISGDLPDTIAYTHYLKYENYLANSAAYGEGYITRSLKEPYACAVTAMLNVCANNKFYNDKNYKIRKKAYEDLWLLSGTKYNKNTGEYGTDKNKIGYSVAQFARQNRGVKINYSTKSNPSVTYFVSAINNGYSSILGISSACTDGGHTGVAGHAYSVIGFKSYAPCNNVGNSKIYLKVATGWGTIGNTEYILYNEINVISKYGTVWKFKP